jgi:hypothetical protein
MISIAGKRLPWIVLSSSFEYQNFAVGASGSVVERGNTRVMMGLTEYRLCFTSGSAGEVCQEKEYDEHHVCTAPGMSSISLVAITIVFQLLSTILGVFSSTIGLGKYVEALIVFSEFFRCLDSLES